MSQIPVHSVCYNIHNVFHKLFQALLIQNGDEKSSNPPTPPRFQLCPWRTIHKLNFYLELNFCPKQALGVYKKYSIISSQYHQNTVMTGKGSRTDRMYQKALFVFTQNKLQIIDWYLMQSKIEYNIHLSVVTDGIAKLKLHCMFDKLHTI